MSRAAVVLRPQPGAAATLRRLQALGLSARAVPLFAVEPVAWDPPDLAPVDALLVTSANAMRHGGPALTQLADRPVVAVGEATARAARAAGFTVALVGDSDAAAVVARARGAGWPRLLHLAGEDRVALPDVPAITLYASRAVAVPPGRLAGLRGTVVLLHSARAAGRLSELVARRGDIRLAAISAAVADAAGAGWQSVAFPAQPDDALLCALARGLAD